MSDFDFDELDKAVADVLQQDEPAVQREEIVSQSAPLTPEPIKPEQPKPSPAPAPAARRSGGRFMDVMHPSSTMRTRTSSFTPPVPRDEREVVSDTDDSQDIPNDTTDAMNDLAWSKPLESPFLPDAKVEKRPLGAAFPTGETAQNDENNELLQQASLNETEEQHLLEEPDELRLEATTMPDPIDFAAQSSALESETEDTGTVDAIESQDFSMPDPIEQPESTEEPQAPSFTSTVTPEVNEPVGPTSITQQYEEKPREQQESGAIYDTESYHQPVAELPKKQGGAWTILWIILLVILGAGAGVAFYLFVLPML